MTGFGEYMVLLDRVPLTKPYGHTFDGLDAAKRYCDNQGIAERAEIVEVVPLGLQFEDEEMLNMGYLVEHVSGDKSRHLLRFCSEWGEVEKFTSKNRGLNLDTRKLMLVSSRTLDKNVRLQTCMDNVSP